MTTAEPKISSSLARSLSHPSSPIKELSSLTPVKIRPKSSTTVELEDLEPGGVSPTPTPTTLAAKSVPSMALDVAVDTQEVGAASRSLTNLRFTPIVAVPGQTTDEDDSKSAGGESYQTAASTLTLANNNNNNVGNEGVGSPAMTSLTLSTGDFCKICHCGGEVGMPLIAPCFCSGSLKYVHSECLQRWIKSADIKRCELCKYPFSMHTKVKPFCQWEKLDMSTLERRKLLCSVTFHAVAVTCVVWSLYVLVDRTAQEIRAGQLQWPFWTKLVVVAIGFTGGLVFMYIQCRVYFQLCRKWKAYNRVIVVQDAPEGIHTARLARKRAATAAANIAAAAAAAKNERQSPDVAAENSANSEQQQDAGASGEASGGDNQEGGEGKSSTKMNAETQTAIRGAAVVEAILKEQRETATSSSGSTTKHLRKGSEGGVVGYFTECEIAMAAAAAAQSSTGVTKSASPSMDCLRKNANSLEEGTGGKPLMLCEFSPYSSHSYIKTNEGNVDADSQTQCSMADTPVKSVVANEHDENEEEKKDVAEIV